MNQRNLNAETETVLLTGACHPVGAQFAREFARHGYGVALVDKDPEELGILATEIREQYGAAAVSLVRDLAKPNAARALRATTGLRGFSPTVLVNCLSSRGSIAFAKISRLELEQTLRAGVIALTELCREFLEEMQATGSGTIVNVINDTDDSAVSLATAAYLRVMGEALAAEFKDAKIEIATVAHSSEPDGLVQRVLAQMKLV